MKLPALLMPVTVLVLSACNHPTPTNPPPIAGSGDEPRLITVAEFADRQVTGVAVSPTGRVFVNFPRWSDRYDGAVAEVLPDGSVVDFPDRRWNSYHRTENEDVDTTFVCVQSVVADNRNRLWVLDPGAPFFEGPIRGAAKLVCIDLDADRVVRVIPFDEAAAPTGSYLNDVRVDTARNVAYITDSGLGALLVVDLSTGQTRRVLVDHPSTKAEPDVVPVIGGKEWRGPDGNVPPIHADGIALTRDGEHLYYHALTGKRLYRIPTDALLRFRDDPDRLAGYVEDLGPDFVTDGMLLDGDGNLYLTALEADAIIRRSPRGKYRTVIEDPRIMWPDSLAIGPNGDLYVTRSMIHLGPDFNDGKDLVNQPWAVYRMPLNLKP